MSIRMSADRQAMALVEAMNEVGRRLDRRRAALAAAHGAYRRDSLRQALTRDLDRLSNLVSLSDSMPSTDLAPATVRLLEASVATLRGRMKHIGLEMAVERLNELHVSAREWTRSGTHPLGKSLQMREEFIRYVAYLRSMAGGLSSTNRDMVADTLESINALIQHDRRSSWLRSFTDDEPIALIDPRVADFALAEEEQAGAA
ncbi:hypothetical protein ACM64Y_09465 [Novispirillum sp. DQ9]|uniref:hypothetical protein n=1 Tax=Novispirillum sp. DQ9 TaxID=3398612 RepID=UPI003C7A684F